GWTPNWAEPDAKVTFQDMTNVLETGPCLRSLQIDYDDEVETHASKWLYDRARDTSDRPFMLTVSFTSPHDPYVARPEFWDMYDADEIDLPNVPPIGVEDMDAHSARIHRHYSIGKAEVTDDIIRRARHGYYASIEYIDAKVAALMQVLEETGLDKDTLVIFVSDHGDMMGERGLYYKKSFFEWSSRVPMIFWAGDRIKPGRCKETVSLLDLLPTFAELAGSADEVLEADGTSLVPCLSGGALGERIVPAEFLSEGVFEPAFMLVRDRLKLLYSATDPPLLFDLDADPDELRNIAQDPRYSKPLDQLMAAARETWDIPVLTTRIIKDQNRRRLIDRSHKIGKPPVWDYQPITDASRQYVRAGKWTTQVEATAHLPLLSPK
ncbi:MAG: sulfatase-like hydrolase/transferase, partial [Pseudomonadota bacterium]